MRRNQILARPGLGGPRTQESKMREIRRVTERSQRETLSEVEALTERVDDLVVRIDDQDAEIAALKAEATRRKGGRPKKATQRAAP